MPMTEPPAPTTGTAPYDAFLLVSFGGPEGPDEVMPFLERVTRGRGVPPERLQIVGEHYFARGGISPINGHCRRLLADLGPAFQEAGVDLPLYWGNRNSEPFLDDTIARMRHDGVRRALAFVTSAYGSYSGCRQYRENIEAARDRLDPPVPEVEKLRVFFNHPGFIEPFVDGLRNALDELAGEQVHVLFSAHSIPSSMAAACEYEQQVENAADLVAERILAMPAQSVVWQSRSGPPTMPWLEPDICDAIRRLDPATTAVVVVPVGFVSDHMEVIQDLDTDAAAAASAAGLRFVRVPTPATDPRFIAMIVELVRERIDGVVPVALGSMGLVPGQCAANCCPPPMRPQVGGPARA